MSTIHNENYTIHKMCYMDAIQDRVHAQNYTIHKLYYMNAIQATIHNTQVVLQSCNPRLQIQGVCPSAQVPRWQDVNNATQFASVTKAGCRFGILKILRFHRH